MSVQTKLVGVNDWPNNSSWVNTSAQNGQILDIKSMVLGTMVNFLGLGNPHKHMYTIASLTNSGPKFDPNISTGGWRFGVRMLNYDPLTQVPTNRINGVDYSYRLLQKDWFREKNAMPVPSNPFVYSNRGPGNSWHNYLFEMEEFTTDTSENAWSSVSSINSAFHAYSNHDVKRFPGSGFVPAEVMRLDYTPSLFNFGVYYDGMNAMGGQYQPRHALTYDDAGGLKYLYQTNTYRWETVINEDFLYPNRNEVYSYTGVYVVTHAQYLPDHVSRYLPDRLLRPSDGTTPAARNTWPLVQGYRRSHVWGIVGDIACGESFKGSSSKASD